MKRCNLVIVLAFAALASSCDAAKTDKVDEKTLLASVNPAEESNIDVYSVKTYSKEEYCDFLGESFDDYLGDYLSTKLNFAVKKLIRSVFEKNDVLVNKAVAKDVGCSPLCAEKKWGVRVYNYSYLTLSYTGEQIKLSAALCVPVLLDSDEPHTLDAMSLCPPHMPIDKEYCPTMNGTVLMTRLAFNHAVVVPDYQGRGITSSKPYSSLHTHDHAVQAIHAALAARTILRKAGYEFKDGLPLYNVGVSEGGETAYEVQKMIENDIPEEQRQALNLKLSFCANGIAQHSKYVTTQMGIFEYTDEESFKLEMDFFKDAFDCFSETEKQGHTGEEFYSHDLLDKSNGIILSHPLVKVLQEGLVRNDIGWNWNPQHPLSIAGSVDDNDVLFDENALYMFNLLQNTPSGAPNINVSLNRFRTPVSAVISDIVGPDYMFAHVAADIICFVHAIRYEDPGSVQVLPSVIDEEQ